MGKQDILSNDLMVCREIYKGINIDKKPMYFTELVKRLEGRVSRVTIKKSIDILFDLGIVNAKWEKIDNKWIRIYGISGEAEAFIKNIYDETKDE